MMTKKHIRYYKQLDREIEKATSRFSQYLMSNSKWVKLIGRLVENIDKVKKIKFKKVQGNEIGELFLTEDTTFGFDYWQNGFEGHNSIGGWLTFKEIEFLVFPKYIDSENKVTQDLHQIIEIIQSVGQYQLEFDEEELIIRCYKQ